MLPFLLLMPQQLDSLTIVTRIGTGLLVLGILAMLAVSVMDWLRRRAGDNDERQFAPRRRDYR